MSRSPAAGAEHGADESESSNEVAVAVGDLLGDDAAVRVAEYVGAFDAEFDSGRDDRVGDRRDAHRQAWTLRPARAGAVDHVDVAIRELIEQRLPGRQGTAESLDQQQGRMRPAGSAASVESQAADFDESCRRWLLVLSCVARRSGKW